MGLPVILYIVNGGLGWSDSFLFAHSRKAVCVGILAGYGPGLVMGVVASCFGGGCSWAWGISGDKRHKKSL